MTEPTSSTGKRVAVASARAAGATIAIGIAVVAIAAAGLVPIPSYRVTPASVVVTPVATPQQAVCPGAFLGLGTDEGANAGSTTAIGAPSVLFGPTSASPTATALEGSGTPTLLQAGADSSLISGSQVQSIADPAVTGFAAAACALPSTDAWLVGGSTAVGRTTLITLANPTEVTAVVALDIYGESGGISAPGTTGISVEPHAQVAVPLSGFAPDTVSPVVHVTSTGGAVVANFQQSVARGLETAGADLVGTTAKPATSVAIPGLVIVEPESIENRIALGEGSEDLATIVRVFVPGTTAGTATISVIPETGDETGASFPVDLAAATVVDIPLDGLAEGDYLVAVDADVPVVAAVRVSSASTPDPAPGTSDLGWITTPSVLTEATSFTVSPGPAAAVHIANRTDAATDVTLTADDGTTAPVQVPAGASVSVPVAAGTWQLESVTPVSANVGYASDSQLASFSVDPQLADASPIEIYP